MSFIKTIMRLLLAIMLVSLTSNSMAQKITMPDKSFSSVRIAALHVSGTLIKAAEQMPEEDYTFRPTPEVRSFGELMAHIAESNYEMCAIAKREKPPVLTVGVTKTEVIDALKKSFAYCLAAFESMTKEQGKTLIKFMGGKQTAANILDFSVFHALQSYGNIIVYMRLKGLVPPSSQPNSPGNASQ